MAVDRPLGPVDPRQLQLIPADLGAILAVTILFNAAMFAPIVRETPLRIPLVLAFVLFVPGYALVAALYPERGESPTDGGDDGSTPDMRFREGIDGPERVALSFGLSMVTVPIIGLLLTFTPWGIRLIPIAIGITAFSLITTGVAIIRRWSVPEVERFRIPYSAWLASGRDRILRPDDRADAALTVLLIASVLLAAGSAGYAASILPQDDEFSTVTLLTEDDGELVADEYPTEFEPGESQELVLAIDNQEEQPMDYTVVVVEQDAEIVDNETTVHEQQELERFEVRLDHDETETVKQEIEPTLAADEIRIVWLVYPNGDVPDDPSTDNAAYSVYLWGERGDE
ncbi:DUF1616 domain-containing protein [Halomontanus rarus]|uniref:DUF1616 domain-containing protein n=1 Tax=Halomontanus rarus TaxID=3034020 RepID=UPI001A98247C